MQAGVTVNANATAGTISGYTTSKCVGDQVLLYSDGDEGGNWTSSDETVATVDIVSGKVTGVGPALQR